MFRPPILTAALSDSGPLVLDHVGAPGDWDQCTTFWSMQAVQHVQAPQEQRATRHTERFKSSLISSSLFPERFLAMMTPSRPTAAAVAAMTAVCIDSSNIRGELFVCTG